MWLANASRTRREGASGVEPRTTAADAYPLPMTSSGQQPVIIEPTPTPPRRWIGPAILLVALITPVVILILSNRESSALAWAGWEWEAPRWLVLTATFVAGMIGGKLFGWLWRSWRRRRRRLAEVRDATRRMASSQGG